MSTPERQREIFLELTDTLVEDFEISEFCYRLCERCVEALSVAAAGLLLADVDDNLAYLASSDENSHLMELFQIQNKEGPCRDGYEAVAVIEAGDLAAETARWPQYAPRALELGFRGTFALPMRWHHGTIGSLNLFTIEPHARVDLGLAQGLADMATVGIMNQRRLVGESERSEQLQGALNSRVVIEQAKGVIGERAGIPVDEAFTILRAHSRNTQSRIGEVARAVVAGELGLAELRPGLATD